MRGQKRIRTNNRQRVLRRRRGAVLVLSTLLLALLLGTLGIVLDVGLLMATYRQTQNAADAAALAGAYEIMRGNSTSGAEAVAAPYVQNYNGFAAAQGPFLHIPPISGAYAGSPAAVQAIVTVPTSTWFMHVLGLPRARTVTASSVAAYENVAAGEGAIALDPFQFPGIGVSGNATIVVHGDIQVNSQGGGLTENGVPVNNGNSGTGISAGKNGIFASNIRVVGGVNDPALFKNVDPSITASPLHTKDLPEPDPLATLPTPYIGNGVINQRFGRVTVSNGQTRNLTPGIYDSITVSNGAVVVFAPGIYVLTGGGTGTNSLQITGGAITADGVMFYVTGSNYDPVTGAPDNTDPVDPLNQSPPPSATLQTGVKYGAVTLTASVAMSPINVGNAGLNYTAQQRALLQPFDGMLYYQRRKDPLPVTIQGDSAGSSLQGTMYAKWSNFQISGNGNYTAQFLVGSLTASGNGVLTITFNGSGVGKAPQVFLVE
jgi:Flp pilus assembly protein TadG